VFGTLVLALVTQAGAAPLSAPVPVRLPGTVAESYETTFDEVMGMRPLPDRVATVKDLVITRDAGRFTLQSGRLALVSPVGGRTVAAVFTGSGTFAFAPTSRVEQDRLMRIERKTALEVPVSEVLFLFADSTLAQLERAVSFVPAEVGGDAAGLIKNALDFLGDKDSRTLDPDLMGALLNGEESDLFYAYLRREWRHSLHAESNEVESVRLSGKVTRRIWSRGSRLIRSSPEKASPPPGRQRKRTRQADIKYVIETWLPQTGMGEIGFSAAATMEIVADTAVGPWVAFELFEKLKVDSARWSGGEAATVFRGKESELVWVKLDRQIRPGDVRTLQLHYHGDLIDRYVDFFQIKSSAAWYPRSLEGRSLAKFDLTFHTWDAYLLASVGDRVDSSGSGATSAPLGTDSHPQRLLQLGLFRTTASAGRRAAVTVMVPRGPQKLSRVLEQQKHMRERGRRRLQEPRSSRPCDQRRQQLRHRDSGLSRQAFPGWSSLWSPSNTSETGDDEVFRAHEVAHQWWGIGVDFVSYHDQWLSEGFSNFSGLWYLQTVRKDNDKYFDILRRWRGSILLREGEPGPISLGHRVFASKDDDQDEYQTVVYEKGAWVVHMLRILMLDLKTDEDRSKP
jgi:hypothetical protein